MNDPVLDTLMLRAAGGERDAARVVGDLLRERGRVRDAQRIASQIEVGWEAWSRAHALLPDLDHAWSDEATLGDAKEVLARVRGRLGYRHGLASTLDLALGEELDREITREQWAASCRFLREVAPSLSALRISERCPWLERTSQVIDAFAHLPGLREVHLERIPATASIDGLALVPHLEHLGVVRVPDLGRLGDLGLAGRLRTLAVMTNRDDRGRRLYLDQWPRLRALRALGIYATDDFAVPQLEELDVGPWPSAHAMARMARLRTLAVREPPNRDRLDALRACPALRTLAVEVDGGDELVLAALAELPLESLRLHVLRPRTLEPLFEWLRRMSRLEHVAITTATGTAADYGLKGVPVDVAWLGDGWPCTELTGVELLGDHVPSHVVRFSHHGPTRRDDFAAWPALRELELRDWGARWGARFRLDTRLFGTRLRSLDLGPRRLSLRQRNELRAACPGLIVHDHTARLQAYLQRGPDYLERLQS